MADEDAVKPAGKTVLEGATDETSRSIRATY